MTWKKFITVCFSCLFIFLATSLSNGCGGDFEEDAEGYYSSYFTPEIFGLASYRPLFFSGHSLYNGYYYGPYAGDSSAYYELPGREFEFKENLKDWKNWFKNIPSEIEIREIVYKADSASLIALQNYASGKNKKQLGKQFENNSLAKFLHKNRKKYAGFIPYLLYVRACSRQVSSSATVWDWREDADALAVAKASQMKKLLDQGLKDYNAATSDFLKMRYGFQVVRLAHYSGEAEQAIKLYNSLVEPLKINSPVRYWALAHKAGALINTDQQEEGIYNFAVVFANSPGRRVDAYEGFADAGGGVCETCLEMARNNREKSVIWLMKGLIYETDPLVLEAMREIYKLDPKSENLELLLARELNKLESDIYELDENGKVVDPKSMPELKQAFSFVKEMAEKENTLRPFVWWFGAGYLAYLKKDFALADFYFEKVKKQAATNELMNNQIHLLELVQKYEKLHKITTTQEPEILRDIQWLESKNISEKFRTNRAVTFVYGTVANLYRKQNDEVKYALITSGLGFEGTTDYRFYPKMVTYLRKPGTSELEQFLLKKYPFSIDFLLNSQAKILISNYQFKEAVSTLKQVSVPSAVDSLLANPFSNRINDCHDCDYAAPARKRYSALSFSQEMLRLQNLIKTDPKNAAKYHLLLGNAYYNLTYFGNAWNAAAFERSYEIPDLPKPEAAGKNKYNYSNTLSCKNAQREYETAASLSSDKELAAEATFMAAKCEQNQFLSSQQFDPYESYKTPLKYRNNFRVLKQNYTNTNYYQEIIAECSYFADFVSTGK